MLLLRDLLCLVAAHGLVLLVVVVDARTDSADVSALNNFYSSLNSPSQLRGWKSSGGDPCDQDWEGITCSGSSVTEITLSGIGLSGSMGYQLSSLKSLTYLDLSKNNLQGNIPYQLPPNANHINLAQNSFNGGIPYSISQMTELEYLNLTHNQLNGQLIDVFGKLSRLTFMDLSFNQISGNLPQSFGSLSSLKTLYLQNNQFRGHISVLAKLPLKDLNIENNQFSGWIPDKLNDLSNFDADGNSWSSGPAPPGNVPEKIVSKRKQAGINGAAIAGIVVAVLVVALLVLALMKRKSSSSSSSTYIDDQFSQNRSLAPLVSNEFRDLKSVDSSIDILQAPSADLKPPPPVDHPKSYKDNDTNNQFNTKRRTEPSGVVAHSLEDLQDATGSFGSNHLVGKGSIGHVYKAKCADGKVLAVKKLDRTKLARCGPQDFMEIVCRISQLRHPNIAELVGYCSASGHCLLVYDFQRNGSLHDFLHLSDEYSKPLTWDTRVRIALGTARAIEYLHEACSPPVVHKNIKSANILLDSELNPHLSDCGLTSFYTNTDEVLGEGYSSPECTASLSYTIKSDVYSFGVVMLELLTGKMPFDNSKSTTEQSLVRWAMPQLRNIGMLPEMSDPALRGLYPPKSLSRFRDTISLCVQPDPDLRPPMSELSGSRSSTVRPATWLRRKAGARGSDEHLPKKRSDDSDYLY